MNSVQITNVSTDSGRVKSAKSRIKEIQDSERGTLGGIQAINVGRPRQFSYDIPDEEVEANNRSCILLDLVTKIEELQVSSSIRINFPSSRNGINNGANVQASEGCLYFNKLVDCNYKNYMIGKADTSSTDETENSSLRYKMLN